MRYTPTAAEIAARAEAIEQGAVRYRCTNPCKHGHSGDRYTLNGRCVACEISRVMRAYESRRAEVMAARAAAQKAAG